MTARIELRKWTRLGFGGVALCLLFSCGTSTAEKSTGSNWLECTSDGDCAAFDDASCSADGFCVDANGHRIPRTASSTGGAGGSGGSATGGASSTGGQVEAGTSDGGSASTECPGSVDFRLLAGGPAILTPFCIGAPQTCGGGPWLTILDGEGVEVPRSISCVVVDCVPCERPVCPRGPACPISNRLQSAGIEETWDGTHWVGGSTCGGEPQCSNRVCAEPGRYVARFCAYALEGGDGGAVDECEQHASDTPTCVEVPFDYPGEGSVTGVLDERR